ncbi:Hypothetical predicted protein, partial [Pelobates cultripes]
MQLTIASIYAPNNSQTSFIKRALNKISSLHVGHTIICGDLNCTLDPELDIKRIE